ncbi:pli1 [Symbiodinium pilosum]|uniref:Pli1 protein n=1 Tax=Symbiodinium pilosum TaxID=2952 RepID=A0A812WEG5_SYMPI|nr:pli1 [Symbiodinium pilosum]
MKAFNSRWRCPTCSCELRPPDLIVDSFVQMLLKETTEEIEEVLVLPDGSWRLCDPVPQRDPSPSPVFPPVRQANTTDAAKVRRRQRRLESQKQGERAKQAVRSRRQKCRKTPALGPVNKPLRRPVRPAARLPGRKTPLSQQAKVGFRQLERRPVRSAAARRAAAIAAGPNRSVGVDSDASAEMVSDSDADGERKPNDCKKSLSVLSGRVGPAADIEVAVRGGSEKLFELASRPAIRVAVAGSYLEVVQDRLTQEHSGGVVWETAFFLLRYLQQAILPGMRQDKGCRLRVVELGAGCGLLGLGLSRLGCEVLLTEQAVAMGNLVRNVEARHVSLPTRLMDESPGC